MSRATVGFIAVVILTMIAACSSIGSSVRMPGTSRNESYAYAEPVREQDADEAEIDPNEPSQSDDGQSPLGGLYPAVEDLYWRSEDSFEGTVTHGAMIAENMQIAATGSRYVGYTSFPGNPAFSVVVLSQSTAWTPYLRYDVVPTEDTPPQFHSVAIRVGDLRWDYPIEIESQNQYIQGSERGYAWVDIETVIRIAIADGPVQMRFYSDEALSLTYAFSEKDRQAVYYMLRVVLREDFGSELTLDELDTMLTGYLQEIRSESGKDLPD